MAHPLVSKRMIKIRQKQRLVLVAVVCAVIALTVSCNAQALSIDGYIPWNSPKHPQVGFWQALREDLCLPCEQNNASIQKQIRWYQRHPKHFQKILKKSEPFLNYVYHQTKKRSLPAELALIPIIESEYNPNSGRHSGPAGMWQIMPDTAHRFGLKINKSYDGRRDVSASTKAALDYLSYLHTILNKDWLMAVAAYQTGEVKIKSLQAGNKSFWQTPLAHAHTIYLPKLLALASIIKDPDRYHMTLPVMNASQSLQEVNMGKAMDLTEAAQELGVSLATLRYYNPALRENQFNPSGPYTLLIPMQNSDNMNVNEANSFNPAQDVAQSEGTFTHVSTSIYQDKTDESNQHVNHKTHRKQKNHYKIKHGDTLGKIAKHYHVSVKKLKDANHIKETKHLKLGQQILIPCVPITRKQELRLHDS